MRFWGRKQNVEISRQVHEGETKVPDVPVCYNVGEPYPHDDAPPFESTTSFMLGGNISFVMFYDPPFATEMSSLEETNYLQSILVAKGIGWPVISFLFGANYVVSNAVIPTSKQLEIWAAAEINHFHFMIVDRTTNILMKNRLMAIMPDIKANIIECLQCKSSTTPQVAMALAHELPTIERLAGGRCWIYSREKKVFSDVPREDVREMLALKT